MSVVAPSAAPAVPLQRTARGSARAAHDSLRQATNACRECPIGEFATQSVIGDGALRARLMLVGEQPGDQEDRQGLPFVGPAGRLLQRAFDELGWQREKLYLTNAVKHFKFELRGKRRMHKTPGQREAEACLHWLEDEVRLVHPRAFVALGATAARSLAGRPVPVMQMRGQWVDSRFGPQMLVTLHPSALLRGDPLRRESAWDAWLRDLSVAAEVLA